MKKLLALLCLLLCLSLCACSVTLGGDRAVTDENGSVLPPLTGGDRPPERPGDDPGGSLPEVTAIDLSGFDLTFSDRDTDGSYSASGAARITFSAASAAVSGRGATASGTAVTVSAAGTYLLSGSCADGSVTVSAGEADKITLVLDSLSLTNPSGPAIFIRSADKVFLTLADGSDNLLADAAGAAAKDGTTALDGAVFSRCDLTVNGSGRLTVRGNAAHGIVCKDDLILTGGSLTVTAQKTALAGSDSVKIGGSPVLTLTAGTDGICADNAEDPTRGFVLVSGGELRITAGHDGVQAESLLCVTGGTLTLTCGGGSAAARSSSGRGARGTASAAETVGKGLKCTSAILVSGGSVTADCADDAVHSNGTIEISGGTLTLSTGDDGIHADLGLTVTDGSIDVRKSVEGLESSVITIAGGSIRVTASDDGINAAGGNDGNPTGDRFARSRGTLVISGGTTVVNASGDGLDSNGTITVSGGVTLVSGPTDNGNSAFDYESSASVSGGVLIALGSSGMAQGFSSAQNQGAILCNFTTQSAGKTFAVCDESGTAIASFTSPKQFASATVTAPGIQTGGKYTLVYGAQVTGADENGFAQNAPCTGGTTLATVTMTSAVYGGGGGFGPGVNPGGNPGGGMDPGNQPPGGGPGGKPDRR